MLRGCGCLGGKKDDTRYSATLEHWDAINDEGESYRTSLNRASRSDD